MARRLRTPLPVSDTLLEPSVITGVTEKLRVKHQTAKHWYDKSARDLPELSIGQDIRMIPLPGDRTGRWRRGVCLQQVGPRSYLVDVEATFYRRNRVDLRPAEKEAPGHQTEQFSKQQSSPTQPTEDKDSEAVDSDTGYQELRPARQTELPQSINGSLPMASYRTTSGRLVKAPNRLDL